MRNIEEYSNEYNKADFEEYEVKYRRKKILEIISRKGLKNILEIGCGKEPLFKYLSDYDKYVLVEPLGDFYKNALEENEHFDGKQHRFFINNFFETDNDIKKHEYDCIICSSLLHELENPQTFLKHLRSVCNDRTLVHINVPNANSFHRVLAMKMGLIDDVYQFSERNYLFQQQNVFGMKELVSIVLDSGFKIVEKGGYFLKPFTHAQMLSMIESGIIDESTLDGLDLMCQDMPDYSAEIYVNINR